MRRGDVEERKQVEAAHGDAGSGVLVLLLGMSTQWKLSLIKAVPLVAHAMIDLGTGARIFLNRYIGLDLNLRDRLQYRDIASGEPAFVQTLSLGLGVGIFLTPQPTPGAE